jgi:molybdopterin molybdotransferase/putative molybdopterin biosynthesis protein
MNDIPTALRNLARQEQFLEVVDRDEATARFQQHLKMRPLGAETIPLSEALGRILACAVIADVDVPGFDRSSVDGFAVRADDTTGASERQPNPLVLNAEILTPGTVPAIPVLPGTATLIATGGMVPRGADAVVMVEHTDTRDQGSTTVIDVRRAVVSGAVHRLCRQRSRTRRDRVARRTGADITRDRHACSGRNRRRRSGAAASRCHHLDR